MVRAGRLAVAFVLAFPFAFSAAAATRSRVAPDLFTSLHAPHAAGAKVRIERVPLAGGREQTLVLEPFDVLAPNAEIEVFDANGKPQRVKPQPMRQYRGSVAGDPDSVVYLSVKAGRKLDGFIINEHRKYTIFSDVKATAGDVFVDELSATEEQELTAGIGCDVEGGKLASHATRYLPRSLATQADGQVAGLYAWPTSTAVTVLNLAVETDTALYANFGNNAVAAETFIRNLIGAASTIYRRDLRTEIRIPYLGIHTASDPFAVNPGTSGTWDGQSTTYSSFHALLELGDRWHTNPPTNAKRSAAMLISGQQQTAGIAWIDVTCDGDFGYGAHWGGAYSYCGGVGLSPNDRTVPNPDASPNFAVANYGYWPLMQVAHEFGHNVQSNHTHCIQLSPADQTAYGRGFVDGCYNGEAGGGCFSGTPQFPDEAPDDRGTIMSYCHLLGGGSAIRFTFGQPNEASHTVIDNMRARLDSITPTGFSSITAPASVASGANANASVLNSAGLTYDWTITNGTFSGGGTVATGAAVTFKATTNPVMLKVTATNSSGCSISDSVTIPVNAASVAPPANVVATASGPVSIGVTWSAASGATSYNVYRGSSALSFSLVGNTSLTSFTDNAVSSGQAYLYKVRAVNGAESGDSNVDLATTFTFTDPTLAGVTMKAVHVTQLRLAVNAVRTLAGLTATTFSDPVLTSSVSCKRIHITELRTALNAARTNLGLASISYTDVAITAQATPVKAAHVYDLRNGVR